jgi:hypothetical protein
VSGEWKDALVVAVSASIFFWSSTLRGIDTPMDWQFTLPRVTIYRVLCEHLEAIDRVTDAIECLLEMTSELGGEVYMSRPITEWVSGEFMFYLFVFHTYTLFGQISLTNVSPLPGATVTRQHLMLPSIHRPQHHF